MIKFFPPKLFIYINCRFENDRMKEKMNRNELVNLMKEKFALRNRTSVVSVSRRHFILRFSAMTLDWTFCFYVHKKLVYTQEISFTPFRSTILLSLCYKRRYIEWIWLSERREFTYTTKILIIFWLWLFMSDSLSTFDFYLTDTIHWITIKENILPFNPNLQRFVYVSLITNAWASFFCPWLDLNRNW